MRRCDVTIIMEGVRNWLRSHVPRQIRVWLLMWRRQPRLFAEIGFLGNLELMIQTRWGRQGTVRSLHPRGCDHSLHFRVGASDIDVFYQIFIDREYSPLLDLPDVQLIVDCGANVGYSAAFFLSAFPACHVIAVEPDADNFSMLKRNLCPFGKKRVRCLQAGVWPNDAPLKVSRGQYRDGREWAVQVRPAEADEEPDFLGVSIAALLASSECDRISLLKIDIEGAEAALFKGKVEWLDRVDAIAIELHEDSSFGRAKEVFNEAIRGRGFDVSRNGELTICRRKSKISGSTGTA